MAEPLKCRTTWNSEKAWAGNRRQIGNGKDAAAADDGKRRMPQSRQDPPRFTVLRTFAFLVAVAGDISWCWVYVIRSRPIIFTAVAEFQCRDIRILVQFFDSITCLTCAQRQKTHTLCSPNQKEIKANQTFTMLRKTEI